MSCKSFRSHKICDYFCPSCISQKAFRSRRIGTEGQVVSRLLTDYDPATRPPVRDNADHSSILVITNIFINRVNWQDSRAEIDLYLRQQWEDGRLQYDVDPREEIEQVSIPSNRKIWMPDTYFSTGNEVKGSSRQNVVVEPSGFVRSSQQKTVDVPVTYGNSFPFFNRRSFTLRLSSYAYPLEDVVYLWANSPPFVNPVEVSSDLLTGPIYFEEASAGDCVGNFTLGTYSCIDVVVTFSSSTYRSLIIWFLPTVFLIIASWLHFWVHGSWSVPRTVSAALPFLIIAVTFLFRQDIVTSACGICCWFTFSLIITFLSLIEYFIVICCGIRRSIRYTANGHPDEHPIGTTKETLEVAYDTRCANIRNNNGIDIIARLLFPLIFIVFLVIYFIIFV
ncbi:Neurotransmitter-gated ion-channel ligand binding domain protein [Dictyocaulus viviparus]|uniref:Neurotransmitter-gated ion-channel ligand binding domain protein n=1 Tax=Dictyocaulus viviparus TaxID=29172 RepID=A0A0D8XPZ7_DICVI|nr:Neurotransmitter-gated ion-channel ligand binding domain protein [Dictyocaulus viviparus]